MFKLDVYDGLYDGPCRPRAKLFPLIPVTLHFTERRVSCSRIPFPVALAWASI